MSNSYPLVQFARVDHPRVGAIGVIWRTDRRATAGIADSVALLAPRVHQGEIGWHCCVIGLNYRNPGTIARSLTISCRFAVIALWSLGGWVYVCLDARWGDVPCSRRVERRQAKGGFAGRDWGDLDMRLLVAAVSVCAAIGLATPAYGDAPGHDDAVRRSSPWFRRNTTARNNFSGVGLNSVSVSAHG